MPKDVIGSVMVLGGGIAGMQAALDLADSGYYVYLCTWLKKGRRLAV